MTSRILLAATLVIAIQVGEHRFYRRLPGKPERLVEIALFTNVWKKSAGAWKVSRVLSYDHQLTD